MGFEPMFPLRLAPLVGLAPTDTGLKGQPHDGLAFRGIKWLRGFTSSLMPDKLADGGGHSPQTLTGSLCFQDRPGAVVQFTIHKNGYPGSESHSRPLPSQGSALGAAELRDN